MERVGRWVAVLVFTGVVLSSAQAGEGPSRWLDIGKGMYMACEGETRFLWGTGWDDFLILPRDCKVGAPPFVPLDIGLGLYAICRESSFYLFRPDQGVSMVQLPSACDDATLRAAGKWRSVGDESWWTKFWYLCIGSSKLYYGPGGVVRVDPAGCRTSTAPASKAGSTEEHATPP